MAKQTLGGISPSKKSDFPFQRFAWAWQWLTARQKARVDGTSVHTPMESYGRIGVEMKVKQSLEIVVPILRARRTLCVTHDALSLHLYHRVKDCLARTVKKAGLNGGFCVSCRYASLAVIEWDLSA